jgi:hypothetical protein
MIDPKRDRLSIRRQCRLVSIARSSYYYEGRGESLLNLRLMRLGLLGDRGFAQPLAAADLGSVAN